MEFGLDFRPASLPNAPAGKGLARLRALPNSGRRSKWWRIPGWTPKFTYHGGKWKCEGKNLQVRPDCEATLEAQAQRVSLAVSGDRLRMVRWKYKQERLLLGDEDSLKGAAPELRPRNLAAPRSRRQLDISPYNLLIPSMTSPTHHDPRIELQEIGSWVDTCPEFHFGPQ